MIKQFDEWNEEKKSINESDTSQVYFSEKEIWWCHLGVNVGSEQDGKGAEHKRPVLIIKKFTRSLCWVIPLSLKVQSGSFFFPLLSQSNTIRMAVLLQFRVIDIRRLVKKVDSISDQEYTFIKEKVIAFLQ